MYSAPSDSALRQVARKRYWAIPGMVRSATSNSTHHVVLSNQYPNV